LTATRHGAAAFAARGTLFRPCQQGFRGVRRPQLHGSASLGRRLHVILSTLSGHSKHSSLHTTRAKSIITWTRSPHICSEAAVWPSGCAPGRVGDVWSPSARKGPSVAGSTAALPAALPAALVVFTTTTSPQLPPFPLPPPHVERGVSPVVLSRCDAGSGCRTSPLTLPSSPNNSVESPRNRENYYFWYCPSGTT